MTFMGRANKISSLGISRGWFHCCLHHSEVEPPLLQNSISKKNDCTWFELVCVQ